MVKVETRNAEWFQKTDKKNAEKLNRWTLGREHRAEKPRGK
jgi:hypothetical protein